MDLNLKVLAENLKFFREAYGYTQDQLGQLLKIQRQSYCNYENARRCPSIEFLKDLAKLYDISLDMLTTPQEKMTSDDAERSVSNMLKNYLSLSEESQKEAQNFISYLISKESQDNGL